MIASLAWLRTVDLGVFGPIGASLVEVLCFHLRTVFGLIPYRRPTPLCSLDYAVSLTDRLRRAGAPVKNLPHVPSLSAACEPVPSYTGTEYVAR